MTKTFDGRIVAVDGVTLDIAAGEFFSLLGPSGCGKTTLLRMIAGFEFPTRGEIYVEGARITDTPAHLRPSNMVFQSYAIFPHLNVFDNIAYGLRKARLPHTELARRVAATASSWFAWYSTDASAVRAARASWCTATQCTSSASCDAVSPSA